MLNKGFTLLEAIVAIFLITVGIFGISGLISQMITSSTISRQKLIAAYLAQEGIEIVRNIRDKNLIEGRNWDDGLAAGDWQADYDDQTLFPYSDTFLNLETSSGLYGYGTGNPTIFKRKITINKPQADILEVKVQIFWSEKGRSNIFIAQGNLYNWR
jgi:type II secretory pathway pseudopilin PulG